MRPAFAAILFRCLQLMMLGIADSSRADEPVDFNRDIRPILSDNCYKCHGPDEKERQAGLRLDQQASATARLESRSQAVVPGDPNSSALITRVTSANDDLRMPPASTGKKLTGAQISLLRRWIEQGAVWRGHWSFIKPVRPELPEIKDASIRALVANPIDAFIFSRLEKEKLRPAPQASKTTLIRRATYDLTGLPPTLAEVDAFLADESPDAYEKLIDRLLASPRYGEHMARYWLDAPAMETRMACISITSDRFGCFAIG